MPVLSKAQSGNSSSIYITQTPLYFHYVHQPANTQSIALSITNQNTKQLPAISSGSISDLPFFCALECKVRKHTNIWIKLRAGDDASYMKMIGKR